MSISISEVSSEIRKLASTIANAYTRAEMNLVFADRARHLGALSKRFGASAEDVTAALDFIAALRGA